LAPSRGDQIIAALSASSAPLKTSEIARAIGVDVRTARPTLHRLLAEGVIQRSRSGGVRAKDGEKERTWRIKPKAAVP
jgi:Mn-dependent DtxR family transcriptional regulator